MTPKTPQDFIPTHKQAMMLCFVWQRPKYCDELHREYKERMGKRVTWQSIYQTMRDLEKLGCVNAINQDSTRWKSGNQRKYYSITNGGKYAHRSFKMTVAVRFLNAEMTESEGESQSG